MARVLTATAIRLERITVRRLDLDGGGVDAEGSADYEVLFNDGTVQQRRWIARVTALTIPTGVTGAQAKTALQNLIGYVNDQAKIQEGL